MPDICAAAGGVSELIANNIFTMVAVSAVTASVIIAASYMIGQFLQNPRLTAWSKSEVIQLLVSVSSAIILVAMMSGFCSIQIGDIAAIFSQTSPGAGNIYQGGMDYLRDAAIYAGNAKTVVRYHLEAYTVLSSVSKFECDFPIGGGIGLGCMFGYSGTSVQPFGTTAYTSALNVMFNSAIISQMSALNLLIILSAFYKGIVFLFLPLGIFLRTMPYMRGFGALLIALSLSFIIVFPLLLGALSIMGNVLIDKPAFVPNVGGTSLGGFLDEGVFNSASGLGQSAAAGAFGGSDSIRSTYFPDGDNPVGAITFAACAFVAAVFLPMVALLGAIGSTVYLARLYGEEIDLSRITQLV